jgi:hypothetical protein
MRCALALGLSAAVIADAVCAVAEPAIVRAPLRASPEPPRVVETPKRLYAPPPVGRCPLPKPSGNAVVIVLGLHEGDAASDVALGSEDRETTAISVIASAGNRPIYLLTASFDELVLDLDGDRRRFERIVLLPRRDKAMAVSGIAAGRVTIADQQDCDLPHDLYKGPAAIVQPRVMSLLGQRATAIGGDYNFTSAVISDSGLRLTRAPAGYAHGETLTDRLARSYPAGLKQFEPIRMVASAPVTRYRVLPSGLGLAQLLKTRSLEVGSTADVDRWFTRAAARQSASTRSLLDLRSHLIGTPIFIVRNGVRFPANLCGANSAVFVVAPDVPMPEGSPCHSILLLPNGTYRGYDIQ